MADVSRDRLATIAVPAGLVVGCLAVRLPRLGTPRVMVFDEIYYALDATDLLRYGVEPGRGVHPPLGKWLMAGGIQLFGFTPFGWRSAVLVAGALTVLVTYLAARQLVAGRTLPALAAGAVALDGVMFTTGRISLLDGLVALFTTAAVAFVAAAYRDPQDRRRVARCRWGAAVCLGLGLATKWSALLALAATVVAFVALDWSVPRAGRRRAVVTTLVTLIGAPLLLYVAAFVPWFANAGWSSDGVRRCGGTPCDLSVGERVATWIDGQWRDVRAHRGLEPVNPSSAPVWTWATQSAPTVIFTKTCDAPLAAAPRSSDDRACAGAATDDEVAIVAVGNPALWWPALAAGGALVWQIWRERNRQAVLLVGIGLALWAPWMFIGRDAYLYYAASLVPVLALWLVTVLEWPRIRRATPWVAGAIVAGFVYLYPVLAGLPVSSGVASVLRFWEVW